MIKHAAKEQMQELKRIWIHEFHDTEEYLDQFMSVHFAPQNVYVNMHEREITSVVYLIPAHCYHDGSYRKTYYLFAVTTQKEFRGHHYFEKILKVILEEKGCKSVYVLIPEPDVIPYYTNCGFMQFYCGFKQFNSGFNQFSSGLRDTTPHGTKPLNMSRFETMKLDDEEVAYRYKKIRDRRLKREGYISWSAKAIRFELWDSEKDGYSLFFFNIGRKEHIMLTKIQEEKSGKMLLIRETTLSASELEDYVEMILKQTDCVDFKCEETMGMVYQKNGLCKWEKDDIYLKLGLDG